jgi:5-methylcytosine-specific restriction endonuclease McrA
MTVYIKTAQGKKRRGAYFRCESCGDEFYVSPSYVRKSKENGTRIRFCSMKCYDKKGEKNPFFGGKHSKKSIQKMKDHPNRSRFFAGDLNPNFTRFGTEFGFRGSRSLWWRKYLLETVGKCEKCGMNDKRILNLHHKDRNRSNNIRENLSLLCWNCHALDHYEAKDGYYHFFGHGSREETNKVRPRVRKK